jgi:hypothetical protein
MADLECLFEENGLGRLGVFPKIPCDQKLVVFCLDNMCEDK